MPQVDKITLMPQVFWLVLLFLGVYFYISRTRLKPLYFFIKFKYSFLLMNFYFYITSFAKTTIAFDKNVIFKNYYSLQKNIFNYVQLLENIINTEYKHKKLNSYSDFMGKFNKIYIFFNKQYENLSKNSI